MSCSQQANSDTDVENKEYVILTYSSRFGDSYPTGPSRSKTDVPARVKTVQVLRSLKPVGGVVCHQYYCLNKPLSEMQLEFFSTISGSDISGYYSCTRPINMLESVIEAWGGW